MPNHLHEDGERLVITYKAKYKGGNIYKPQKSRLAMIETKMSKRDYLPP
jgi:hypothetical protein